MKDPRVLDVLEILKRAPQGASLKEIGSQLRPAAPARTLQYWLQQLVVEHQVRARGAARSARYFYRDRDGRSDAAGGTKATSGTTVEVSAPATVATSRATPTKSADASTTGTSLAPSQPVGGTGTGTPTGTEMAPVRTATRSEADAGTAPRAAAGEAAARTEEKAPAASPATPGKLVARTKAMQRQYEALLPKVIRKVLNTSLSPERARPMLREEARMYIDGAATDQEVFVDIVVAELSSLTAGNCERYEVAPILVETWQARAAAVW